MTTHETVEGTEISKEQQLLEEFVLDNRDLYELESLVNRFNLFEAIGAVRQELRHSDFLAFILDPHQSHGLGDSFLKRLLQVSVLRGNRSTLPISPIDFDVWSLDEAVVRREWHKIDLFIEDAAHKLIVGIENKVDSGEHSNQLQRSWKEMSDHYHGWTILGILLAPEVRKPSDDRYVAIDYALVYQVMGELLELKSSTLGPDIRVVLTHYSQLLRRHIVANSDIAELCRQIYHKHKAALDLIYEHRPDLQGVIRDALEAQIKDIPDLTPDYSSKSAIRFSVDDWDSNAMKSGSQTSTGRLLLFEITNVPRALTMGLSIGPGPVAIRQRLLDAANAADSPLKVQKSSLNTKWNSVYRRELVKPNILGDATSLEDLEPAILQSWGEFRDHDLPRIIRAFHAVTTELKGEEG